MANVKVIEATSEHYNRTRSRRNENVVKILRVAAYVRVSTDSVEQKESFESQKRYYEQLLKESPDMELVEIYADEAISGTQTDKRTNFNRMILDAMEGRFNVIVVKNISRFARNTLDTLKYVRQHCGQLKPESLVKSRFPGFFVP